MWLGRGVLIERLGARFEAARLALMQRGLTTTAVVRDIPGSPFALVSVAAGASDIRFLDYLIGTAIGIMVPVSVMTVATDQAFRLLTGHQTPARVFPPDIAAVLPPLKGHARSYYYADLPDELIDELWRRFIEALAPLKAARKLLTAHFQFAPWSTNSRKWRAHVEECVQRMEGHLLSVEFRNATWLDDDSAPKTLAWLSDLGVVHTIVDEPQGVGNYAHGVWEVTNPKLAVVRLHGRNAATWDTKGLQASSERFNYEYTDAEVNELSASIDRLAERAFEVVALLNVNHEDQGVRAARALIRRQQVV